MPELDDVDSRILGILVEDGRRSFREVARRAGVTTPTVQARVKRMMEEGLIRKISPIFDVSKFKQGLVFHLYLQVNPAEIEKVAQKLEKTTEVRGIYLTTGENNLTLRVVVDSLEQLQRLTETLDREFGVKQNSSQMVVRIFKDDQTVVVSPGTEVRLKSETCLTQFQAPEKALTRLKQLVLVGTVLTVPITALTYLPLIPSKDINNLVMFLLSVPVQFVVGFRFYRGSYDALRSRIGNMDLLIALGTSAAWAYSSIVTFFPAFFPSSGTYFETSGIIITLILTGNLLERLTKQRASESVRKLLELQPTMATVIRDGGEVDIPIEDVRVDDLFVVRPGERVPIDGVVAEGRSALDESMITGESLPRDQSV